MFEQMIQAMGNSLEKTLQMQYQIQKDKAKKAILERHEREKLIEEICEEVLKRISIKIKTESLEQLDDIFKKLRR